MKRSPQWLLGLLASVCFVLANAQGQSIYSQPFYFTTIAGSVGVPGTADGANGSAKLYWPEGIAIDTNGVVYVADNFENTIRTLTRSGTNWIVATIAGLANPSGGSSDGTNNIARFNQPIGLTIDGLGNLYVADYGNNTIRKVSPIAGNWVVTTIAGTAGNAGSADGTNGSASFNLPSGITVDASNNLYVAEIYNSTIRKITPMGTNWVVSTIAGKTQVSANVDGTNGASRFSGPSGIAADISGNLYVADTDNQTIRKITPVGTNWVVRTIAGQAGNGGSIDGLNLGSQFNYPSAIAVDSSTNLYLADTYNHTIRKVAFDGTNWFSSTLAGTPEVSGATDDLGAAALFNYPEAIAVDAAGTLFVGDTFNYTVRKGIDAVLIPLPKISVALNALNQVVVTWPDSGNATLQTNTSLTTPNWGVVDGGDYSLINGTNTLTLTPTAGSLFFRLTR